ncbi:MAG: SDR family oxidoreductase [Ignavibacteria bacterium]|nr:SDR family oxidoreductase [Ignavibacteria bacterium]
MKILFIGGTGVISTACSELCVENGFDLYLMNRNLSIRKSSVKAKTFNADIRDFQMVRSLIADEKFDVVVDWIAYNEEHVKNDFELFKNKTEQFVFISSASAYQKPPPSRPITEDTPLHNPFWSYSQMKIDGEKFLMKMFREEGFPVTICRPSHTYDKTRFPLYGSYTAFNRMKQKKNVIIHGNGETLWTLTNAKDFAKGFVGLLGNTKTIGEAYHITSDETLTWNEIAKIIAEAAGLELKISHLPVDYIAKYDNEWGCNLLGDKAYSTVFDNSKIRKIVPEFKASIAYREGVREVIDWYSHKENQVVNTELDALMDKMISDNNSFK